MSNSVTSLQIHPQSLGAMDRLLAVMLLLLLLFNGVFLAWAQNGTDIVFYVSPNGSNDTSCGRSLENPCNSIQTILDLSPLFNTSDTVDLLCYLSRSNNDGRLSTTLYFLEGVNYVPPVCLVNWSNLRIAGHTRDVTVTSTRAGQRAFFDFRNCTNLVIENLTFDTQFVGKAVFYILFAVNITFTGCHIPVTAYASEGIYIASSSGRISVEDCTFAGSLEYIHQDNPTRALYVSQGHGPNDVLTLDTCNYQPYELIIRECRFMDISSAGDPIDRYTVSHTDGMTILLHFRDKAADNIAKIEGCNFTRITNTRASNVLVNYERGSANNSVSFRDCLFYHNNVQYGGGITAYFYSEPRDSILTVDRCTFVNNSASFEGGGISVVFLSNQLTNKAVISSCEFISNTAQYGSAVFLFNNPAWFDNVGPSDAVALPLVPVEITNCTFQSNIALRDEGVVNSLRIHLFIRGSKYVCAYRCTIYTT